MQDSAYATGKMKNNTHTEKHQGNIYIQEKQDNSIMMHDDAK